MTDVAFTYDDDELFNAGYDIIDVAESYQDRCLRLNYYKSRLRPYIRTFAFDPGTDKDFIDLFTEMLIYNSDPVEYSWLYEHLYKIADAILKNTQILFTLSEAQLAIIANIHSNTADTNAIEYANDIIFAAMEAMEHSENRPEFLPQVMYITNEDRRTPRTPTFRTWEPVIILEKNILVKRSDLWIWMRTDGDNNDDVWARNRYPDALLVEFTENSSTATYKITRRALGEYSRRVETSEPWVTVKLLQQRTWTRSLTVLHRLFYPPTSNIDNYIMARRLMHNSDPRILFLDRRTSGYDGELADYPDEPNYVPIGGRVEEEEEEEEKEEESDTSGSIQLPNHIANLIVTDAMNKGDTCSITFEPLRIENTAITSCFHLFDHAAIDTWLKTNDTCPLCRHNLTWLVKPI